MATALLEKQGVLPQQAQRGQSEGNPAHYRWSVDKLYRAIDANVFDHPERLELVHGRIIENMAQDPVHRTFRVRVGRRFQTNLGLRFVVIEECPVHIASDSELTPDVAVLYGREADYDERHPNPEDVAVLVEISNTTVVYDLGEKALLYAQANIADYWVVLVKENAVVVHRDPTPSGYSSVTRLAGADTLSPLALPEAAWTIDTLLGREDAPEGK